MTRRTARSLILLSVLGLLSPIGRESATAESFPAQVSVYFSPHGGCTEAIAHNKNLIIDGAIVLTSSFNFAKAAEEKNTENLVILKGSPELAQRYLQNFALHAVHSHPYQRSGASTSQGSEMKSATPEASGGTIHANRKSKVYHLPVCPGDERLSEANLVTFAHEATAKRAGYRKAKNCP